MTVQYQTNALGDVFLALDDVGNRKPVTLELAHLT